jgi:hypothetical protein
MSLQNIVEWKLIPKGCGCTVASVNKYLKDYIFVDMIPLCKNFVFDGEAIYCKIGISLRGANKCKALEKTQFTKEYILSERAQIIKRGIENLITPEQTS